jgi:hypothetical protein|tara:strand:+ start:1624 stop:1932 length:309 start_codon:yes stop_codon:yes gene_type:complete
MILKEIKYKRRKIKIIWEKEPGCYAIYDPDANILKIDPKLSKRNMAKTIFHELWHIVCYVNKININKIGEERTAKLAEEFVNILIANPKLERFINGLLVRRC